MLLASLVLAAAAAALLVGRPGRSSALPSAGGPGVEGAQARPDGRTGRARQRRGHPLVGLLAAAAAVAWVLSSFRTGSEVAVAGVAAGAATVVTRMVGAARRAGEASRRRQAVIVFCEGLVGELRAGQPVLGALERSAAGWPEVLPVLSAARLDADIPAALRRVGKAPGAEALTHLAAAWQLSSAIGGGLIRAAAQVLESARADAACLRQVQGEVSSARATARLVAALPVVVLVAGQGLGARPWAFLLGHPAGVACLAGGVLLVLTGLAWIDRLAAAAISGEA